MKRLAFVLLCCASSHAHEVPWVHDNIPDDADGDGMADSWEKAQGLNPNHPADGEQDADLDGFSNREEFIAKTNPREASEHPAWFTKLYVQDINDRGITLTMIQAAAPIPKENGTFTWSGKKYITRGLTTDGILVLENEQSEPLFLPARSRRIALKINRMRRAQDSGTSDQ